MTRRIVFATIALAVVFSGFFFPRLLWMLVGLVGIVAVLCTWEITAMMKQKGLRVYRRVASLGVLALVFEATQSSMEHSILVFGMAVCVAWVVRMRGPVEGSWGDVSATVFTLAYVGIPCAALVTALLSGAEARAWLLLAMGVIWMTDSTALFTGKAIGKHKLWPKISPGKTWEGSFGGVVGALVLALVARVLFPTYFGAVHPLQLVLFAVVFSVIGQLGDLAESLLKRDVGVKDSGSEWTGHGGFLDLMDAVLFSSVPLLVYLRWFHPEIFV